MNPNDGLATIVNRNFLLLLILNNYTIGKPARHLDTSYCKSNLFSSYKNVF